MHMEVRRAQPKTPLHGIHERRLCGGCVGSQRLTARGQGTKLQRRWGRHTGEKAEHTKDLTEGESGIAKKRPEPIEEEFISCAASVDDSPGTAQTEALNTVRLAPSPNKPTSQSMQPARAPHDRPSRCGPGTSTPHSANRVDKKNQTPPPPAASRSPAPGPQQCPPRPAPAPRTKLRSTGGACNRGGSQDSRAQPSSPEVVEPFFRGSRLMHSSSRSTARSP